jgi:hypothetical protein
VYSRSRLNWRIAAFFASFLAHSGLGHERRIDDVKDVSGSRARAMPRPMPLVDPVIAVFPFSIDLSG